MYLDGPSQASVEKSMALQHQRWVRQQASRGVTVRPQHVTRVPIGHAQTGSSVQPVDASASPGSLHVSPPTGPAIPNVEQLSHEGRVTGVTPTSTFRARTMTQSEANKRQFQNQLLQRYSYVYKSLGGANNPDASNQAMRILRSEGWYG